jgi:hypothetical protein
MTSRLPSKHRRAALLVFHGIGEQNPYQPLDAFVRGLRSVLQLKAGSLEHVLLWRDDKAVTAVRLKLDLPSISDGNGARCLRVLLGPDGAEWHHRATGA